MVRRGDPVARLRRRRTPTRYKTKRAARARAMELGLRGTHSHGTGKNKIYMPGRTHDAYERALRRRDRRKRK